MRKKRTAADQQIADLLVTAKKSLDLSVAFLSRMDGTTQHLEVVETSVPVLVQEGAKVRQDTSFCQAILDGRRHAAGESVRGDSSVVTVTSRHQGRGLRRR